MQNDTILRLCMDNEGLRVEVYRMRARFLIVLSKQCDCAGAKRTLMYNKRFIDVLEPAALPDALVVLLHDMLIELNSITKMTSHSHEKEHASTTGLRLRS